MFTQTHQVFTMKAIKEFDVHSSVLILMCEKLHPNHLEVVRKASGSETAIESSDMIIVVWENNGNSYSLSILSREGGCSKPK